MQKTVSEALKLEACNFQSQVKIITNASRRYLV